MPAKVTLIAISGKLAGQTFVFHERTTCIVGRSEDCGVRIPTDKENRGVSRHHCLIDINPPDMYIRDFGSLNGTYVNERKIGQRKKGQTAEEGTGESPSIHPLQHGDEIRVGTHVFRVDIRIPVYCVRCAAELPVPADSRLPAQSAEIICPACGYTLRRGKQKPKTVPAAARRCARCDRDVAAEVGSRSGEYVCAQCRTDPFAVMDRMLQCASSGDRKLVSIAGYKVLRELGRGGMGAVYLAQHERSGRKIALKVMLPQVAAEEGAVKRFLREMEVTKSLHHQNIVRLFASGCYQGTFFLALEYCSEGSVEDLMCARGRPFSIKEAIPIILQSLDGLSYAHTVELDGVTLENGNTGRGCGLVHRDIKPANIYLAKTTRGIKAKVGDYGLAKSFDLAGLSGHTFADAVGGTPQFMPRQQVLRFKYAKPEVDVWAAAASLYNMLTGRFPREFAKHADPWLVVLQTKPVPIQQRAKTIPNELARVINEALVDDPEIRFKSAADFKRALKEAYR